MPSNQPVVIEFVFLIDTGVNRIPVGVFYPGGSTSVTGKLRDFNLVVRINFDCLQRYEFTNRKFGKCRAEFGEILLLMRVQSGSVGRLIVLDLLL